MYRFTFFYLYLASAHTSVFLIEVSGLLPAVKPAFFTLSVECYFDGANWCDLMMFFNSEISG